MTGCLLIAIVAMGAEVRTEPVSGYLLRVEVVGYVDAPLTETPPEEVSLRTVEVLCHPGERFLSRTTIGKETTTVSGRLKKQDSDEFLVDLQCSHVVDTGQTVPVAPGKTEKILDITSSGATAALTLGRPFVTGGIETKSHDQYAGRSRHRTSRTNVVITLVEDRSSE